jgi:hypothetical protein
LKTRQHNARRVDHRATGVRRRVFYRDILARTRAGRGVQRRPHDRATVDADAFAFAIASASAFVNAYASVNGNVVAIANVTANVNALVLADVIANADDADAAYATALVYVNAIVIVSVSGRARHHATTREA